STCGTSPSATCPKRSCPDDRRDSMTRFLPLVLAGLALAAPAAAQSVLRIVPHADLSTLDPIQSTARITVNHGNMIYETLYAWDEDLNVKPQMVGDSKRSADGLNLAMTL